MSRKSDVRMRASSAVTCFALAFVCSSGLLIQQAHAEDSSVGAKTQQVTHAIRSAAHGAGQDVRRAGRKIGAGATRFGRKVADRAKSAGKDIAHGARHAGAEVRKTAKRGAQAVKRDTDSRKP